MRSVIDQLNPSPRLLLILCASVTIFGCNYVDDSISGDSKLGSHIETEPMQCVVLASCDTAGWIEPCGCASGQSGGLSRRATLAKHLTEEIAKDTSPILFSVGGAASGEKAYDIEKLRAIMSGEALMGYVAHNLGRSELELSIEDLKSAAGDLKLVSTNVKNRNGDNVVDTHSLVDTPSGVRLLVLGVMSPQFNVSDEYQIRDPETEILTLLDSINRNVQYDGIQYDGIVLLAYLPREELMELATRLPEIDVVLGGPNSQSIPPQYQGKTLIMGVSNKGKFLARAYAEFGAPGDSHASWKGDLHEVSDQWAEEFQQQSNLSVFRKRLRELDLAASETSFVSQLVTKQVGRDEGNRNEFAGSDTCQECHRGDHEAWSQSAHSHAWETLKTKGAEVDSDCQRCHTVGFGLPSGFVRRSESLNRLNVGCESCHGPSKNHVANTRIRTPWRASDTCVSCHDHENSPHFEYDPYWQKIIHGI